MTFHHFRCNNGCKYRGASQWVCFHPNAIGSDGDGVGLTEYEKDHVLRLGCASHSEIIAKVKEGLSEERNKVMDDLIKRIDFNSNFTDTNRDYWISSLKIKEYIEEIRRKYERGDQCISNT